MIILKLKAGLGNQLFQYAYARSLALRSKADLAIDLNWFSNIAPGDTPRIFLLDKYNLPQSVQVTNQPSPSRAARLFARIKAKISRDFFKYSDHVYYPRLAKAVPAAQNKDVEVEGFWNTEKYFEDFEGVIRAELALKSPLGAAANASESRLKELAKTDALALLHVRRGDYVSNSKALQHHGLSGLDYYAEAAKIMQEKIRGAGRKPLFMLASDDMDWVRENIIPLLNGAPYEILSNPAEIKDYEEIYLMSLCQHFIIANSSFSWWGAWLSKSAEHEGMEKIVIGPKRWIADPSVDTSDVLPERWIKI